MNEQELFEFEEIKRQVEDLKFMLQRKTGGGSADVRANIDSPSTIPSGTLGSGSINNANMFSAGVVDQSAIGANAVGQSEVSDEVVSVTVLAAATTGTATVTSGSIILGYWPVGNQDQFVDDISISGTTLTITLGAAATGNNLFQVRLLKV